MTVWMIVLAYVAAWIASSVWMTRHVVPMLGHCHGDDGSRFRYSYRSSCTQNHRPGCWQRDQGEPPTLGEFAGVSVACLAWPLAIPAVLAYSVAVKPAPRPTTTADEIARLEREVYGRDVT